jgi:hypothetical protein
LQIRLQVNHLELRAGPRHFVDFNIADRKNVEIQMVDITNCPAQTYPNLSYIGYHLTPAGSCQEESNDVDIVGNLKSTI